MSSIWEDVLHFDILSSPLEGHSKKKFLWNFYILSSILSFPSMYSQSKKEFVILIGNKNTDKGNLMKHVKIYHDCDHCD